jgi:dephospho-CoA kinase
MLIVGLTGSIGMGKSTAAERFRFHGFPVIDADAEVHKLYVGAAVAPLDAAFPGCVVDGRVDRAKLSAALMADPSGFKRLERIVHPLVQAAERALLQDALKAGAAAAVLEIPLLFETKGHLRCDATVVVSAPADVQRARVMARPGMTAEKLEAILSRQMPDAEKRALADFVVDTSGTIADTRKAIDAVVTSLLARPPAADGGALRRFWS